MTTKYIRPSEYARQTGVHYRTVLNHLNRGLIEGYRDELGNVWILNPAWSEEPVNDHSMDAILYARVSSSSNKGSLEGQIDRLRSYAAARGYRVVGEYTEVASGLNEGRKQLHKMLERDDYGVLLSEHKDRLTRFGYDYLETLLARLGVRIELINHVEGKDNELVDDFVAIITSFCGRIYGRKRRVASERIIQEIRGEQEAESGVPKAKGKSDKGV